MNKRDKILLREKHRWVNSNFELRNVLIGIEVTFTAQSLPVSRGLGNTEF